MTVQLLQGNQACAEGAIAAGCRFFAGYPITPSSEIAEWMARRLPPLDGVFIQMEDEIASLAAVIGASVGGMKALTATSGPGFSLMQENLGYAIMAEIPCVIVNVQRMGPSTGQPTSPSQGDVMQARWGTHGDHPIIVLSPSSVMDCFNLTVKAFNFAERYRTPVILLADEVVAHMRERVELPDPSTLDVWDRVGSEVPPEWYKPYAEVPSDVPPLVPFGEGYRYHITGLYHDADGFPTQRLDEIQPWVKRVSRKIRRNRDKITLFRAEGIEDARVVVVSYGVSARVAREAVQIARDRHHRKVGFLELQTLWPFPEELIARLARMVRRVVVVEMNLGQLSQEVERVAGRKKVRRVLRADGRLIRPDRVLEAIETK